MRRRSTDNSGSDMSDQSDGSFHLSVAFSVRICWLLLFVLFRVLFLSNRHAYWRVLRPASFCYRHRWQSDEARMNWLLSSRCNCSITVRETPNLMAHQPSPTSATVRFSVLVRPGEGPLIAVRFPELCGRQRMLPSPLPPWSLSSSPSPSGPHRADAFIQGVPNWWVVNHTSQDLGGRGPQRVAFLRCRRAPRRGVYRGENERSVVEAAEKRSATPNRRFSVSAAKTAGNHVHPSADKWCGLKYGDTVTLDKSPPFDVVPCSLRGFTVSGGKQQKRKPKESSSRTLCRWSAAAFTCSRFHNLTSDAPVSRGSRDTISPRSLDPKTIPWTPQQFQSSSSWVVVALTCHFFLAVANSVHLSFMLSFTWRTLQLDVNPTIDSFFLRSVFFTSLSPSSLYFISTFFLARNLSSLHPNCLSPSNSWAR